MITVCRNRVLLQGYRTDNKTPGRVRKICGWNQNEKTNTTSRQLAKQFWDNLKPRWFTGTPEVASLRAFHCYVFCARKSTTLAFARAFGLLLFMPFGNKNLNWWIFKFFCLIRFEMPLQVCGWFRFVLAQHKHYFSTGDTILRLQCCKPPALEISW
jgi:hypothetical protein